MLLNTIERSLMNNRLRVLLQKRFEAPRLLRLGGRLQGGAALEIGCGFGVGVELILDAFGADRVDAFDLDPTMVLHARNRLARRGVPAGLWVGDATAIPVRNATYNAVFDFGVLHHVPDWRHALAEVFRVLQPGGRFFAEEVLKPCLEFMPVRLLFEHPREDRFDSATFLAGLRDAGLVPLASDELCRSFAWFVAIKPAGA